MAASTKVSHPSVDERRARGQGSPQPHPSLQPRRMGAGRRPARPGRPARGAERHPRAGPGAGAARPDDGLAVHLLPGRGQDHGGRPGRTRRRPGSTSQLCGDAHLSNFGAFASPERRLLFDLNDFDETLPGRSSTTSSGWRRASRSRPATTASPRPTPGVTTLRRWRPTGRRWPSFAADAHDGHLVRPPRRGGPPGGIDAARQARRARTPRWRRQAAKARQEERREGPTPATACRRSPSSPSMVDGQYRIVSQPPIVVPLRDLAAT